MQNRSVHLHQIPASHRRFLNLRILVSALVGLIVLGISFHLQAGDKILFIGNSYTFGASDLGMKTQKVGGVPGIFSALAQAGGQGKPTVVMRAVGGKDFKFHSQSAATLSAIKSCPWDYVVLQDYSTEPTHYVDSKHGIANQQKYGLKLYDDIMANNPKTRVILYETWSRPAANQKYIKRTSSAKGFASTSEMQQELRDNYSKLARLMNATNPTAPTVIVAPVGDAWQNAGGLLSSTNPGFVNLFRKDKYHGNDNGYYLAAAVFYSCIYGVSPQGLSKAPAVAALHLNFTVSPTHLEDVAWSTVKDEAVTAPASIPQSEEKSSRGTHYNANPSGPSN